MIHWEPFYPAAVYVAIIAAVIGLLVIASRVATSRRARSPLVLALRGAALGCLILLLLNPVDRRETVLPPRQPSVAILVDCSQSMVLGQYEPRIERVKRIVAGSARAAKSSGTPKLHLFRFGKRLAKAAETGALTASDDTTDLASALERLPSRTFGEDLRAVVVFSDGAIDTMDRTLSAATAYRRNGLPLHCFTPVDDQLRGDLAIEQLVVPSRVTPGSKAIVRASIHNRGFDNERVLVSVRSASRPHELALAKLPLTLSEGTNLCELPIPVDDAAGDLVLEIPTLTGEAIGSNNQVPFRLPIRDRRIKVFYMEGTAGTEYTFLRDALQEDPNTSCVSAVVNNQYAQRPTIQRVDDPYRGFPSTRKELFQYDVVICSDIPRSSFTPEQIEWTVDLVNRRGGGFVMVGGHTSFGSGGWDQTPWDGLIPFDMAGRRDYLNQTFQVEVPAAARSHPIMTLLDDPQKNTLALQSMPRFFGTNVIARVKPAATLLGQSGSRLSGIGVMPVLACESFGRGRTFAMATDTTAYWGRDFERRWGEGDNRYYRKFWRNVVGWLSENSYASQQRLIIHTDRVLYAPGDPIEVSVEAFDENAEPTTAYRVTAQLRSVDPSRTETGSETAPESATELEINQSLQRYEGSLDAALSGQERDPSAVMQPVELHVTLWRQDEAVSRGVVELQLVEQAEEWLRPNARPDKLRQICEASGGKMIDDEGQLRRLLSTFQPTRGEVLVHTLPQWDRSFLWALFVGLLGTEWVVRRRGN
ncbi:hypothetical protein FYK55_17915 [Roseiconus nitratireducens]|uniref:Putative glutamine amidotransferase domain-containing protein n=1 Tax=Roseiconus nitratireducens TaxID=2605748 RepID=A0A5M6D551_9BACT|nr:glutamine amidotransferase [Roseiconus nitratireducens]KAA5541442.1 hypothetical protein FYK55_17915 [Roseiconus nitratireducens]